MKQKKLFSLSPEDVELLRRYKDELERLGFPVNESDIVAFGLKQIERQGGVFEAMTRERELLQSGTEVKDEVPPDAGGRGRTVGD